LLIVVLVLFLCTGFSTAIRDLATRFEKAASLTSSMSKLSSANRVRRHALLSPYLQRNPDSFSASKRQCPDDVSPCVLSTPYGNATEMFFEQACSEEYRYLPILNLFTGR
jgi:hypothetical protein